VHSPKCGAGNRPLDKQAAVAILEQSLGTQGYEQGNEKPQVLAPEEHVETATTQQQDSQVKTQTHFVIFDIETKRSAQEVGGWNNTQEMGVSCAVLFDSKADAYFRFSEPEVPVLLQRLFAADMVIGFNIRRFDYQVLNAYTTKSLQWLPTLDLLQNIRSRLGYYLSLDHLAGATLGVHKTGNGLQAVRWWKEGKLEKIMDYCQEDVALTLGLYLHGRDNGHILFRNKSRKLVHLAVDWPGMGSLGTVQENTK